MQGRVVAVTAVAIATGWKLEKGERRSLKSMQACEAPTSQELLIPNPLDLILLWAGIEFALLAWEPALCLMNRHRQQPKGLQGPQRVSLPPPSEATPARCEGRVGSRVSSTSLDQASCPASLSRAGLM